jgi:hypothetical protein
MVFSKWANRVLQVVFFWAVVVAGLWFVGRIQVGVYQVPARAGQLAAAMAVVCMVLFVLFDDRETMRPYIALLLAGAAVLIHGYASRILAGGGDAHLVPLVHFVRKWGVVGNCVVLLLGWLHDDAVAASLQGPEPE